MILLLFLFGLFVGSFLHVLIDRLPKNEDVLMSRSHCDYCKHKLVWYELIPLLSFFMQKGKTRCCHKKLSFLHPIIELMTAIGFVAIYVCQLSVLCSLSSVPCSPASPAGGLSSVFAFCFLLFVPYTLLSVLCYLFSVTIFSSFLVIFIIDLKHEMIPMEMVITGILATLALHSASCSLASPAGGLSNVFAYCSLLFVSCSSSLVPFFISAFLSFLFFFLFWFFSKGNAMGDGDMYLAFFIGFLLGYPMVIVSFYVAFLTGAFVGVILILAKKKGMKSHIPFGPFLVFGCLIALIWGAQIFAWWQGLF